MKRFFVPALIVTLALAACGGSDSGNQAACERQYWDGTVGLCLPDDWNIIERDSLREKGIPDEVMIAFKRGTAVSGQFPTVTVTQEALASPTDSSSYSTASVRSITVLPAYNLIDNRKTTVDGAEVDLHVFTAQPIAEEPERRFYQVSAVAGPFGYTVTGLTPVSPSKELEKEILSMVQTITFKEPAAEQKKEE